MPPKMETPEGLTKWLAIPENVNKRAKAIAKNKAAREEKLLQERKDKLRKAYIEATKRQKTNPQPRYKPKKLNTGITKENRMYPFYATIN